MVMACPNDLGHGKNILIIAILSMVYLWRRSVASYPCWVVGRTSNSQDLVSRVTLEDTTNRGTPAHRGKFNKKKIPFSIYETSDYYVKW